MGMKRLLHMMAVALGLVGLAVVAVADPAAAIDVDTVYTTPALFLPLLSGLLTSPLTAFVTKFKADSATKALTGFVVVALSAALQMVIGAEGTFTLRNLFGVFMVSYISHLATYFGMLKPSDLPALMAPSKGIGTEREVV